jgi:hypothetical protein
MAAIMGCHDSHHLATRNPVMQEDKARKKKAPKPSEIATFA